MNHLATISLVLGTITSFFAILAYLYKGVQLNKARAKAQQGRITSLARVAQIQGQRLTTVEKRLSTKDEDFSMNSGLVELENEAFDEYREHDTKLT
ncbi:hypothetical protein QUB56_35355 [Microcoleus sp. AR_TQ3_B6]|uniref:hypothetical protein n=1 Tax=Microcoleus sp. AR_TQ3_B6 TaxID=3055284 RepID=UPI002FD54768